MYLYLHLAAYAWEDLTQRLKFVTTSPGLEVLAVTKVGSEGDVRTALHTVCWKASSDLAGMVEKLSLKGEEGHGVFDGGSGCPLHL